jgi:hypothetical protein
MPGENIQMVITDASAKDPSSRARALGFLDLPHTYDRFKYREIFMDAIREIDLDGALESRMNITFGPFKNHSATKMSAQR